MKIIGIIPARYASTRFEGKPLADICGKSMIQRVYEQAKKALKVVVVATDDIRISKEVKSFGGDVVLTSKKHNTGTNRCLEAYSKIGEKADVIVNIQGDEPLLEPNQIHELTGCFKDESVSIATLVFPTPYSDSSDGNSVNVVFDNNKNALYFSRSIIPFDRDKNQNADNILYKHVGMYAYTPEALLQFSEMKQTPLEKLESLEQLRWLENGNKIKVAVTKFNTIAVDTPEDLERVKKILMK